MKESYFFPDLPQEAEPTSSKDLLTNNPDNHHAIFGLAEQLSELFPEAAQSEQSALATAEASIALQSVHWRLLDFNQYDFSKTSLTRDDYEAVGLPTTSLCKALQFSVLGAESLNELTTRLYHEQTTPGEATPITDWLSARQYAPDEARVLMQSLRDELLYNVSSVTRNLADMLLNLFVDRKVLHNVNALYDKAKELEREDASKVVSVEQLWMAVRQREHFDGVPEVDVGNMPAAKLVAGVIGSYKRRQEIIAKLPPRALPDREDPQNIEQSALLNMRPQPVRQSPEYRGDPTAQEVASVLDGITDLIRLHWERARIYTHRDPGPSASMPDLVSLLRRQRLLEVRGDTHPHETLLRIIDIMAAFSELGPRSRNPPEVVQLDLQHRLTEFFTFERAVGANIKKGAAALKAVGVTASLAGWNPLESDAILLNKRWRNLLPVVRENWPQDSGQEAVTAIANVLRAFKVYQEEIADPEGRLKALATHLGATILRPEGHPRAPTLDPVQRRNAIFDVLEGIATDEQLIENIRYRAEVLKHFMGDDAPAESQGSQPAELFYFPPTKEQPASYFSADFLSLNGEPWVLIESLAYGKASYILRRKLIEREGKGITPEARRDFLNRHSKPRLVQIGGIQIIHTPGWTPSSHVQSIQEKAAAA